MRFREECVHSNFGTLRHTDRIVKRTMARIIKEQMQALSEYTPESIIGNYAADV